MSLEDLAPLSSAVSAVTLIVSVILAPPGAQECWGKIKSRLNREFGAFIDLLIAE